MKVFAALALISGAAAAAAPALGNLLSPLHLAKRGLYTCESTGNSTTAGGVPFLDQCYQTYDSSDFPNCGDKCGSTITLSNCQSRYDAAKKSNATASGTTSLAPQPSAIQNGGVGDVALNMEDLSPCQLAICPALGEYTACFNCLIHQVKSNGQVKKLLDLINDQGMPAWEKGCRDNGKEVGAWEKVTTSGAATGAKLTGMGLVAAVAVAVSALI